MTSRFQQIRQWLAAQDGPRTPGEIAAGIGAKSSRAFIVALGNLRRDGWLTRKEDGTRWLYSLTDKKPRRKLSENQLAERRRKRDIVKSRAKGVRPWSEWIEIRRTQAEARRDARAAAAAMRREAKAAAKAALKKPLHDRKAKPYVVVRLAPLPVPKKEPPHETVEQWMARTGKTPQVLPIGAVSKPLGLGDFNGRMRKAT